MNTCTVQTVSELGVEYLLIKQFEKGIVVKCTYLAKDAINVQELMNAYLLMQSLSLQMINELKKM